MSAELRPSLEPTHAAFERAVFAVDFSPASLAAARWAARHLAPRPGAVAAHVVPLADADGYDLADRADRASALRATTSSFAGGLGGFVATLPTASARTVVRVGSASRQLVTIADENDADLIVMGRRRNRRGRAVREPHVIERVARRARCPVLVVPHGTEQRPLTVGVAIDAGSASAHVLGTAWRVAASLGARLTILHAFPEEFGPSDAEEMGWTGGPAAGQRSALEAWIATLLLQHGGTAGLEVTSGDPASELLRMAKQVGLDLLVVGKQGADGAPPGSLGSVARHLLGRSDCPVLAVECRARGMSSSSRASSIDRWSW